MDRKMNPKSQENDRQNPLSCKFRYFKSAETQCKSTVSEFFTGDQLIHKIMKSAGPRIKSGVTIYSLETPEIKPLDAGCRTTG
jgi:hypothetical protein